MRDNAMQECVQSLMGAIVVSPLCRWWTAVKAVRPSLADLLELFAACAFAAPATEANEPNK